MKVILCKDSWGEPDKERMRSQDNYSHNNTAQITHTHAPTHTHTHRHTHARAHIHTHTHSQCNQDSLEEKSASHWTVIFLTLHWGESRLGSSKESWILIGWGNSAVVSHKETLSEWRNVGEWGWGWEGDNFQKPQINNLTLHTVVQNNYYPKDYYLPAYIK